MRKCKNCREPFTPIRSTLEKYCMKTECVKVWVSSEKNKQWQKRKNETKAELLTVQDWIKLTQANFNKFIRLRDDRKTCISCNKQLIGKFDAGHFYNANNHWSSRFNENNVHGQCVMCNQHLHGNLLEYRKGLIERIGIGALSELELLSNKTRKFTIDELKEINEKYKQKIKEWKI